MTIESQVRRRNHEATVGDCCPNYQRLWTASSWVWGHLLKFEYSLKEIQSYIGFTLGGAFPFQIFCVKLYVGCEHFLNVQGWY